MGTTPNYAIPYPEPTDFVTDGATAMEAIAEKVDDVLSTGAAARNLLYNGAMQIQQRVSGTTAVTGITASDYYTADRFRTALATLGTWSQSVETDAPTGSGFRKSLKMLCTTADASPAAGDLLVITQILEGQDLQAIKKGTSSAQSLTISFWVKANVSGTYICELYDNDNNRNCSKSYVINATGTWEYKTITFPPDTIGSFNNDNGDSMQVGFFLGVGSNFSSGTLQTTWGSYVAANRAVGQTNLASAINNYWQITGVQLTIGTVAPPFQFKTFAQELEQCYRYFYNNGSTNFVPFSAGGNGLRTYFGVNAWTGFGVLFPATMRTTPTIDVVAWTSSNFGLVEGNNFSYHVEGIGDRAGTIRTLLKEGFSFSSNPATAGSGFFTWRANAELS